MTNSANFCQKNWEGHAIEVYILSGPIETSFGPVRSALKRTPMQDFNSAGSLNFGRSYLITTAYFLAKLQF